MDHHTILGGKVHIYRRENSSKWQCSTYLAGKNRRTTTKEDSLSRAKDFAEDWYLELRGKSRTGELTSERNFKRAAEKFLAEYEVITEGQRNAKYVKDHESRIRNHLIPYFGQLGLSQITAGSVHAFAEDAPDRLKSWSEELGVSRVILPPLAFDIEGLKTALGQFGERVISKMT